MSLLGNKKKQDKKAEAQLQKDIDACSKEVAPIINKYNLMLGSQLISQRNGLICVPVLSRKPEPPKKPEEVKK